MTKHNFLFIVTRRKLQTQVNDFKSDTEEKRRMYNELLAKDKKGVGEIAENNQKIIKLMVIRLLKSVLVFYTCWSHL